MSIKRAGEQSQDTEKLLSEGARFHKPASTYEKLFGGTGRHPEQNLRVISSDQKSVRFKHDGQIKTMDRETFLRLAKKSIAAGAQFFPGPRHRSSTKRPPAAVPAPRRFQKGDRVTHPEYTNADGIVCRADAKFAYVEWVGFPPYVPTDGYLPHSALRAAKRPRSRRGC